MKALIRLNIWCMPRLICVSARAKAMMFVCDEAAIKFWQQSMKFLWTSNLKYRKDPKFSDRHIRANSADPDQTAPRGAV